MKMARQLALQLKSAVTDSLTSAQKECSDCKHPEFVSLVDFNKQMSAKLLEELARVSSKATDAIDNARDCIEKLNLPADYFPQMEGAKTAVRNALTCMATATGARILASKAAARKNASAKSNAADCLKFCQDQSLEIPASLQAQLSDLASVGS